MHLIPKHDLVDRARHSATLLAGVVLVLCGLALVVARG
jgi:cytochrome b subunit of formate dehydrogenase